MGLVDRIPTKKVKPWVRPELGHEPVEMKEAYETLNNKTFAVWIRLHTCTARQLKAGRVGLSKALGLSESAFNRACREMIKSGYVRLNSRAYKNRTTLDLVKRARVGPSTRFVKV